METEKGKPQSIKGIRALLLQTTMLDNTLIFGEEMSRGIKAIFWDSDLKFPTAVRDKWSWVMLKETPGQRQNVLKN